MLGRCGESLRNVSGIVWEGFGKVLVKCWEGFGKCLERFWEGYGKVLERFP